MRFLPLLMLLWACTDDLPLAAPWPGSRHWSDPLDTGPSMDPTDTDQQSGPAPHGDTAPEDEPPCSEIVVDWPEDWTVWEELVLDLTNLHRSQGADCGVYGYQPPAGDLVMDEDLRCAARVQAWDMGDRNYFSHDSPGGPLGDDVYERIYNAGFSGGFVGENIAAGYNSPDSVIAGWLASDGHCQNMMQQGYHYIGVGYAYMTGSSYGYYWVQDFGG